MREQLPVLQTIEPVLAAVAESSLLACAGAQAMVWLVGPADLCDSCSLRSACPSRTSCLHLVASTKPGPAAADPLRRVPIGHGALGRVPVTREPLLVHSGPGGLEAAEADWLARSGARALAALPLEHGERCIGVVAVLAPGVPSEEQARLLTATARLGAEALGNVSAFRALAVERNRLVARNARLRADHGLAPEPDSAAPPPAPTRAPPPPAPVLAAGAMLHADGAARAAVRSFAEVQRDGILRALELTGWRVSGPKGAAVLLRLKPTTLESKMKKLGLHRPRP